MKSRGEPLYSLCHNRCCKKQFYTSSYAYALMHTQQQSCVTPWKRFVFLRQRKTLSSDERRTIRMLQFQSRLLPTIRVQESAQLGLKIKIFRTRWLRSNIGVAYKERKKNFLLHNETFLPSC